MSTHDRTIPQAYSYPLHVGPQGQGVGLHQELGGNPRQHIFVELETAGELAAELIRLAGRALTDEQRQALLTLLTASCPALAQALEQHRKREFLRATLRTLPRDALREVEVVGVRGDEPGEWRVLLVLRPHGGGIDEIEELDRCNGSLVVMSWWMEQLRELRPTI